MSLKSVNNAGTNLVELEIEISAADFEAAVQKAYLKMRKRVNIPGFRKGLYIFRSGLHISDVCI